MPSQKKCGGVDQAAAAKAFGYGQARGQRRLDFHWGEVSDIGRHQTLAKVAVGCKAAGRGACDGRVARKIDGVGDQRCGCIRLCP
jgi:hypothetical protein